jgi:hypothetical protein
MSSPHREDVIKAISLSIDLIKKVVPIWKKEVYQDEGAVERDKEGKIEGGREIEGQIDRESEKERSAWKVNPEWIYLKKGLENQ